jgi:hypothetical protein
MCAKLVYVPYLLLALSALASGGCLAVAVGAVAAGGAAAGYTYYRGGVASDYAADFNRTWGATYLALGDLGMPAQDPKRASGNAGSLDSQTREGKNVHITLTTRQGQIPAAGPITEVQVRVGILGDRALSEKLLDQIQARLTSPAAGPVLAASAFPQTAPPPLALTAEPPLAITPAGR